MLGYISAFRFNEILGRGKTMSAMHGRFAALAMVALWGGWAVAADTKPAKEAVSFGVLESMPADAARAKALDWLKTAGKTVADSQKAFDALWASEDKTVLEKVADSFALGDPEAGALLKDARDPATPAPTAVPALLKDTKKPAFFRANLALAYAKALANKRVYEEGLEALRAVKAEDVVDPSAYLFQRSVAEYSMLLKDDANRSILRLLDDAVDAPERYKMVAALMHFDMLTWREKDLGWVARMMNNIERRLDLARGGPQTQDMQKKVVVQLDEMIKKLEEEQDQQGNGNGSGKNGKPNGKTVRPNGPAPDDYLDGAGGPGKVDEKRLKELAQNWGNLPEKDRAKAMLDLTRDMPARHRELIENYFKNLAKSDNTMK
jgi:hypothetical protein